MKWSQEINKRKYSERNIQKNSRKIKYKHEQIWFHEYEYEIWKNMNLREHSIWRLSKRRLSRSLERNMKHGYSKRRMNQPIADWNTETAKKEIPQTVLSKKKVLKQEQVK